MLLERKKIAMVGAEFLGTATLTAIMLAVSRSNLGIAYFVSLMAGLALAAGVLVFGSVSGAHFNPAVTIGLWTARRVKALPALAYILAQLAGGIVAYYLYSYLSNSTIRNVGTYDARVLVAEAVGTVIFTLGWAATVYHKMEVGKAAFVIGGSFIVGIIVASIGSITAGAILNPAVALGEHSWGWGTTVLGPVLGGIIGFNLYALLFAPVSSLKEAYATKKAKK